MKTFYTDGSADPNPGPGGWAIIDASTEDTIMTGAEPHTTNIRMEGTAIREAIKLAVMANEPVEIYTDSEFWINVLTKWAPSWERNGWKKKQGEIKNLDLVQELYDLYQNHDVELHWVKGHAFIELNELADIAARSAREHQ
ncbi:ribonuclease HI [Candidatus Saccharibacteria bacterium]|nr:ribonuclease HI [Candidatus Saccharibacteria bacterium]MBR0424369.1 ribonuclease HI [Candidatus Saccharibacteria bacterium]